MTESNTKTNRRNNSRKNLTSRIFCRESNMIPTIIFQMKNLATSIIFTTFQLYFNFEFLETIIPLPADDTSSSLHLE